MGEKNQAQQNLNSKRTEHNNKYTKYEGMNRHRNTLKAILMNWIELGLLTKNKESET